MLSRLVLAVVALTAAGSAAAQSLPDFDPVKLCKRQAEAVGQGDWLVKACLDQEQEA